ncbi:ABC transporter ATP-binding protein [Anaerovorax odorimutans]|uniref:ABC transporter ATP-binding protein n=1 Tax=Anaerovorax odorimutans TaxID=109327 RepID=A0ABT1RND7_9FIRM|nr:ABC transporter ATP-binding protein [Anaerovorax odorimutans]MCQ4636706.1 ABC transporter ATP-binding protein [Anaerovorax odorimutans]
MENLIELKKVCLRFDLGFAIDNLTFGVREREIFGFLGPSGAGKTTTIKLLTKQLKRKSGAISLLGKDIDKVTRSDYDEIGILSDTSNLYERMSIQDNLNFFADLRGISRSQVSEVLDRVSLGEQRKQLFKKCSRGMKQRAILASAVLHHPKLLFLDEPTSGLDPATSQEIHSLLLDLNREGTTIFLTTHNMEEADKLCHRVGIINQGKLIACGTPRDLKLEFARDEIRVMTKDRQYVTVQKNEAGAERIAELIKNGDCMTIHSSEPNLEEIFLQLTGREF